MDEKKLSKIKQLQLDIMDHINVLCQTNGISYYMVGGTLIGAMRHKGFIPWDVDIDIAMPREDYIRFKNICCSDSCSKYEYLDFKNSVGFNKPHSVLRLKNTHLHIAGDTNSKYDYGVFVDVFPLDNVPNDVKAMKKHKKKINKYKKLLILKTSYWRPKNLFKRIVKSIVKCVLSSISLKYIQTKLEKECMRYDSDEALMLANFTGKYSYEKEAHQNDVFGNPTKMLFEGRLYFGPEKADEYLKKVYGDYMTLPSQSEQEEMLSYYDNLEID